MDKLIIKFDHESIYNNKTLPDISYEKFCEFLFKSGSSDLEYDNYLRKNNMKELTDFNSDGIKELTLILEQPYRGRVLKFKSFYDSDEDKDFDAEKYFNEK